MKPLILIVEDEAAIVTLLSYNLEREGFQVLEARDGEEGLLLATERRPDLILLDWMLPLLSGIEVCRRLRRTPQTSSIPIINGKSGSSIACRTLSRATFASRSPMSRVNSGPVTNSGST